MLLALQSNLTLEDNIVGQIRVLNFTTSATYTANNTFSTLIVPWTFASKKAPQVILVGRVITPSNQPQQFDTISIPSWTYDGSTSIRIPYIAGLANGSTYTINIVIL